ncbi:MAG: ribbon-helix-helix protein, CopG family [Acidobacteria bacterium]|nr:MAG: ribbon-helix-helix protein, CopG family [Acidobacteriota bacterium]
MKRTTIFIDESLERDLQVLAERQGRSKAAVVRTALERFVRQEKQRAELDLGFVGIGRSGRSDIAERTRSTSGRTSVKTNPSPRTNRARSRQRHRARHGRHASAHGHRCALRPR